MLLGIAMERLYKQLQHKELWDLFICVEMKLTPLLAILEMTPLSVATHTLMQFSEILKVTIQGPIQDFWKGGSDPSRGGSFSTVYPIFHKFPHEIEIIWFKRGGSREPLEPPLNPPLQSS